jgi:hypothetical protein
MRNIAVITLSLATAISGITPAYAYPTMPASAGGNGLVIQVVDQGHDWKHNLQDDPQPIRKHDNHGRDDRHHDDNHHGDHRHSDNRNDHHDDHHHHHNNIGAILGGVAAGALIGGAVAPQRREYDDRDDYDYDDGGY